MAGRNDQFLPYRNLKTKSLVAAMAKHGWVVVRGVPCRAGNAPLLDLAGSLGTVKSYGAKREAPAYEGETVHVVSALARPSRDVTGKPMLSTTATVFDLHTDESFKPSPSEIVLMHCWQSDDAGGGVSLLANSERIAAKLEPWAAALCFRVEFLWRNSYAPIFSRASAVEWPVVRFNAREIAGDAIGEDEPDLRARLLPEIFLEAANAAAKRVLLEAGDCVVLDNRRVLHGRTAFDPRSRRMLKRVWVKAPALAA